MSQGINHDSQIYISPLDQQKQRVFKIKKQRVFKIKKQRVFKIKKQGGFKIKKQGVFVCII